MELSFHSHPITQVGSVNKRTLVVLPSAKQKEQKIAVGDDTGVVTCFTAKRGQFDSVFVSDLGEPAVTAVTLGGPANDKDQIYAAFGPVVKGFKKKGKEFFKFNTGLNEDINSLFVEDETIWTAGEFLYNGFDKCVDNLFFMANDRINHMIGLKSNEAKRAALACNDKCIRVLQGANVYYECDVDSGVSVLHPFTDGIVYGTMSGTVGHVTLGEDDMNKGWKLSGKSAVNCMTAADITQDGMTDIIIGRDDGSVEVIGFELAQPQVIFKKQVPESICSIDQGHLVSMEKSPDIVYATYGGRITTLSYESNSQKRVPDAAPSVFSMFSAAPASTSTSAGSKNADNAYKAQRQSKIADLRKEVTKLHESVTQAKTKYSSVSTEMIAQTTQFKINHSFVLLSEPAYYQLSIEIQHPIDVVILKANTKVILMEIDSVSAIVSHTRQNRENNELLATLRCQESITRLDVKLRTMEGRNGELEVFVVPKLAPKSCQKIVIPIRPLSLHEKLPYNSSEWDTMKSQTMHQLEINGEFSVQDMHQWLCTVLPDMPPRVSVDNVMIKYRSTFVKTLLFCEYSKNRGVFRTGHVSAIATLKDFISREATRQKVSVNFSIKIHDELSLNVLTQLRPKLDYYFELAKKHSLIPALKEIEMAETGDISFLSLEYQNILKNISVIEAEHKNSPGHLSFLSGVLSDMLSDAIKLNGKNPASKLTQLTEILNKKYSFEAILSLFNNLKDKN